MNVVKVYEKNDGERFIPHFADNAIMCKGGGGGGDSTQVVKTDPPEFLIPHMTFAAEEARNIYDTQKPEFFSGQTFVDFSPQTEKALEMSELRALSGNELANASQQQLLNTVTGDPSNTNPYLQANIDAASEGLIRNFQRATAPQTDAMFNKHGRIGSGLHQAARTADQEVLAEQLGDVASNIAGASYAQERKNQLSATQLAPSFAGLDTQNLQMLANVGAIREGKAGEQLAEDIARFDFNENVDTISLDRLIAQLQGVNSGGTSTTTGAGAAGQSAGSRMLGGISGAAGGLGLATTLGAAATGPVGIGAALLGGAAGAGLFG